MSLYTGVDIPTATALCERLSEVAGLKASDIGRARKLCLAETGSDDDLIAMLLRLGAVRDEEVANACAFLLGAPRLDLENCAEPVALGGERFARHYGVIGLDDNSGAMAVAFNAPVSADAVEAVRYFCERQVSLMIGTSADVNTLIERVYGQGRSEMGALIESLDDDSGSDDDIEHLKDLASEAPVIRLVNLILQKAVEYRASDIHVEPFENQLNVRYRIDGVLEHGEAPPAGYAAAVISRLKIMARLDIAERRLPQDGRIMLRIQGRELDLRVSTVPTSFGESVVMRLLDRQTVSFDFPSLGIDGARLQTFLDLLETPHGILLVTGPTGSGKTTTLYTALSRLNTDERKIITVEDPVEYQLQGINQIQVKPAIGLDFPTVLRSIVRQDPDVIMIGEMRDLETCRIAIQSSLTGHLVLSTLHTNSAAASITRLLDMGVEGYLIASTVKGILAQRLVRRLDPATRIAFDAPQELIRLHGLEQYTDERPIRLYRADQDAAGGGYHGRSAITELLVMNEELRGLLMRQADAATLEQAARRCGLVTLYEDGLRQALSGITSLDEVLRVTRGD
ncbi:type II secretion system protein GspE [Pseudomonas sp. v388]|uniref:GspE/PulE family protein n=1 Tax=Pseudomonas sp. v388 TaxID=2479849 RepID=UPI000F798FB6|nr:ATPase, T2SS/T4P/T4SS family [Pseudomonas sp. v388]RRV10690.1 type II secretion system protein GspE [Pseudomonas sp. v388]